ncbi:sphingomyelin phosphodiesterase-like protein [Dinothrombium tinctorium]|uniref:Sphingomyelin phosphodiesterase-like protein n=1 Tax=Dinothrombium tinctorium TaxID=1965070 RepID=A0A443RED9_9ACAR|nr:sphingomyelin phosphodiesterase-like protein [Dinothrombium tinctorium]
MERYELAFGVTIGVHRVNLVKTQYFDIVIWTGDTSAHGFHLDMSILMMRVTKVTNLVKRYIARNNLVSSHRFSTLNISKFRTFEIYKSFSNQWKEWLTPDNTVETFRLGGYYSRIVDNIKIIALNTNLCARKNVWTLFDCVQSSGQLQWLVDELKQAEDHNQRVIITGHLAPSIFCTRVWLENYMLILERFHEIIVTSIFGHFHSDGINVYYSKKGVPISAALLGSSFVSYNPGYKFYSINEKGVVDEMEAYYTNLTKLNAEGKNANVAFDKLYSSSGSYGLQSLTPRSLHQFLANMERNDTLLQLYYKNGHRDSDNMPKICDKKCKKRTLRRIKIQL